MKYNENDLTNLFNNEKSIWQADDLDWFDEKLAHKLQNNKLPAHEKQKLIEMMANDQAVMDRYLSLKEQTAVKFTPSRSWLSQLFQSKFQALIAVGLSLVIIVAVIFNIKNTINTNIENIDGMRGMAATSTYPTNGSTLDVAPEYFITQNKHSDEVKISISLNDKTIWSSAYQRSNKFHLPISVKQQLTTGHYSWLVNYKNSDINERYSFNIR